jgi:hypothetical protein
LWRIAGDNLFDELVVLFGELEGDRGVVSGGVAVLYSSTLLAILSILVQLLDWQDAIGDGIARTPTHHIESIAEPLRTGGKGSELGLGDMASQLAGSPWEGGEEFGSHCWRREEGGYERGEVE